MKTIGLLFISNIFMTLAWYGHLKYKSASLITVIVVSWLIAFIEYCLAVPANRLGHNEGWNTFELKITQEVITLIVFFIFAIVVMKEKFSWNYVISFLFILGAVFFMFKK